MDEILQNHGNNDYAQIIWQTVPMDLCVPCVWCAGPPSSPIC